MATSAATEPIAATIEVPSRAYAWFVVILLTAIYTCNYLDRKILSIVAEPLRRELGLSDTQIGIVTGLAFALFYGTLALPIASLADRARRVTIVAAACAVWSGFTMACCGAASFAQLALLRVGVASGEAGGGPPSYSIIADYFPPERRGGALAVYTLGVPLGVIIGSSVGALVASNWGWRWAFLVVGAPGLALAVALMLFVREPVRGAYDPPAAAAAKPSFGQSLATVARNRALVLTAFSCAASSLVLNAMLGWAPSFLMRTKGMRLEEIGSYYAVATGLAGAVGALGAGLIADRLSARDPRAYALLPALAMTVSLPFFVGFIQTADWRTATALLIVPALSVSAYQAPALALIQNASAPSQRAFTAAALGFIMTVLGLGIGPLLVGIVSDRAKAAYGEQSLGVGLYALVPVFLLSIGLNLAAARAVGRDGLGGRA